MTIKVVVTGFRHKNLTINESWLVANKKYPSDIVFYGHCLVDTCTKAWNKMMGRYAWDRQWGYSAGDKDLLLS